MLCTQGEEKKKKKKKKDSSNMLEGRSPEKDVDCVMRLKRGANRKNFL